MSKPALKSVHNSASSTPVQRMGWVIDHLVDALAGDSSSSLRRAQILIDIDAHPATTQVAIMERLNLPKSTLSREIEWLYDQGCILRQQSSVDGRTIQMTTCGYSKKNLNLALDYCKNTHNNLQKFIDELILIFTDPKPTLRDAKILVTAVDMGEVSRNDLFERAYIGSNTTNVRAVESLVAQGILKKAE